MIGETPAGPLWKCKRDKYKDVVKMKGKNSAVLEMRWLAQPFSCESDWEGKQLEKELTH